VRCTYSFSKSALLVAAMMLVTACSATSTRVTKILDDADYRNAQFGNVLVIAIADSYDRRAQFERTVVSGIRQTGAQATAYYTVVGHNPPVSSSDIMNAVRARNFDAVLFTRVKDATEDIKVKNAAPGAQAARASDDLFDLARYNYKEYSEPQNIRLSSSVVLVSQFYVPVDRKNIWAIEIASSDRESVDNIVASAAAAIVKQLRRDKLVGPQ